MATSIVNDLQKRLVLCMSDKNYFYLPRSVQYFTSSHKKTKEREGSSQNIQETPLILLCHSRRTEIQYLMPWNYGSNVSSEYPIITRLTIYNLTTSRITQFFLVTFNAYSVQRTKERT